jgi:hypothetical protein
MNSRALLLAATAFEGLRAGIGLLRAVLDLPARAALGTLAYAEYFRATDLTTRGVVFYAVYGFGGLLLTGGTWFATRKRAAAVAALASLLILLLTTQAAPIAWQVKAATDPAVLDGLFDRFTAWTLARVACTFISFGALLSLKP